jgi:hypothetical protein
MTLLFDNTHAARHPEGGCDGSEYGDKDVQDFTPKCLVFHDLLKFKFYKWFSTPSPSSRVLPLKQRESF